jgi:ribonucleoside-diphosphate reductase alpha chain
MTAPDVQRERLLNRRLHEVVQFEHGGFTYVAGIGRFDDGKLAEVFLNADKVGTAIETQARDAAVTASLFFQNGGSPEILLLRRALTRNADGSASGALGKLLDILLSEGMP